MSPLDRCDVEIARCAGEADAGAALGWVDWQAEKLEIQRMEYEKFVARKLAMKQFDGITGDVSGIELMPFQRDLTSWALRKGRAALFADTGLGKTRMQLAWAREASTHGRVLILAPLSVAKQTADEGAKIGVHVNICRDGADVVDGINITNYDRLHRFDDIDFAAVVLDESSCIKHQNSKTFQVLCERFASTPYRLCATATPSPNDYTELGSHAEFLGICSRAEMLSEYFCHDGGETSTWRLKGHARGLFWQFVSSWGALVRKPSDLGYVDGGYDLPPLNVHEHIIAADEGDAAAMGMLFVTPAQDLMERRQARRASLSKRVAQCAEMVSAGGSWIVWCELNDEGEELRRAIPDSVEVRGADDIDTKEKRLDDFSEGRTRVLISKPSIAGFGLNWQHVQNMAFVGVNDSFESYYQAVRRCWRFGQKLPVNVHVFASEIEGDVLANLKRKEADSIRMSEELSAETRAAVMAEVRGGRRLTNTYQPKMKMEIPTWLTSSISA